MSRLTTLLQARKEAQETFNFSYIMRIRLFNGVGLVDKFSYFPNIHIMYIRRAFVSAAFILLKLNQREPRCHD